MPLNYRLTLIRNLSFNLLLALKLANRFLRRLRGLDRSFANLVKTAGAELDVGVRDLVIHRWDKLYAGHVGDDLQDFGGMPELVDEGGVAGCHAADLDAAGSSVVHAVVQSLRRKDISTVLKNSFMGEEGKGGCCCHVRELGGWEGNVGHLEGGLGRSEGNVL